MHLLEKIHPSIEAAVDRIISGANKTSHTVIRDFDGCEYHLEVQLQNPSSSTTTTTTTTTTETSTDSNGNGNIHISTSPPTATITISLQHSTPFKELNVHSNFDEVLPLLFPPELRKFLKPNAYHRSSGKFIAEMHLPATLSAETRTAALQAAAQLRIWSYIPVFSHQCEVYCRSPEEVKPLVLHYHTGEEMFLYSHRGNFLVVIALRAASKDDAVFMRHFLQAMMDAKKLQREISAAPAFVFDYGKPPESIPSSLSLSSTVANNHNINSNSNSNSEKHSNIFWCSFQLFRRQMEPMGHLVETVTQLVNFRSTLAYHIHAGRTYMHGMMRKRVETSLQVLNRAKTSTTGKAKITLH
ncbi:ARP2/3 complex subunit [Trypanosoma theileri]|uniref:Arp2/3 complex 34 kDa subunit n=1 Tax=Trypanosoma theileri TaxID=67003 RepID=A0A1X0NQE1_9TRYP|nr:ARP2/3 complex subunit [Trypanosoma theileri]ORC86914.1 ARP2/3 complex subunit [Trypanosoma theileri]